MTEIGVSAIPLGIAGLGWGGMFFSGINGIIIGLMCGILGVSLLVLSYSIKYRKEN